MIIMGEKLSKKNSNLKRRISADYSLGCVDMILFSVIRWEVFFQGFYTIKLKFRGQKTLSLII